MVRPRPNLPREAMAWAKSIEHDLREVQRAAGVLRSHSVANNKAAAATILQSQSQTVDLEAHNEQITELNEVTLPSLQTELDALDTQLTQLENGTLPAMQEAIDIAQATADSTVKVWFAHELGDGVYPTLNDTSDLGDLYYRLDGQVERWLGSTGGWVLVEDTELTATIAALDAAEQEINTLKTETLPALDTRLVDAENTILSHTTDLGTLDGRLNQAETDVTTAQGQINTLNNTTIPALDTRLQQAETDVDTAQGQINTLNNTTIPALDTRLGTAETDLTAATNDLSTLNNTTIPDLNTSLAEKLPKVNASNGVTVYRDVVNYYSGVSAGTGTLVIRTAIPFAGPMIQGSIKIAQLNRAEASADFTLYAYSTNGGTIHSPRYSSYGGTPLTLRFAKTPENTLVILIDNPNGNWAYPRLSVPELQVGYQTPAGLEVGWTVTLQTDITEFTTTLVNATSSRDLNDTHSLTQGWRTTGTTTIDGGKITADSVTAGQIAANAITANELAADAVYANSIQANAVVAGKIATDAVTANTIAANAVVAGKIAANAVTATTIAADAVVAGKIAANAVTANTIAADAVVAGKIAANAVTATTIAADAVTATKIAADAVTAAKIAAGTITGDKIAARTIAAGSLLIGDFNNYFNDPTFSHPTGYASWTRVVDAGGVAGLEKFGTGSQNGTYQTFTEIPVVPGEKFVATGTRTNLVGTGQGTTTTGDAVIFMQRRNGAGAWSYWYQALTMTPAAGTFTSTAFTIPADTTAIRMGFYTQANMPTTTKVRITDVSLRKQVPGTLIEQDTITTGHVKAGAITANEMKTGTITAASGILADAVITTANIADLAVTNAKVEGLSATKITTDTLGADRIGARTITAEKLVVTDPTNYWNDPTFAFVHQSWTLVNGGLERVSTATTVGATVPHTRIAVSPGARYRWSLNRVDLEGTAGGQLALLARFYRTDGTQVSFVQAAAVSGAGDVAAEFVVPAGGVFAEFGLRMVSNVPNGTKVRVTDMAIRRMSGGELIVDGSILATKIGARQITADKIAANTITANEIAANTITANEIAANAITATELSADAITGKTITGGTISGTTLEGVTITSTDAEGDEVIIGGGRIDLYQIDPGTAQVGASGYIIPWSGGTVFEGEVTGQGSGSISLGWLGTQSGSDYSTDIVAEVTGGRVAPNTGDPFPGFKVPVIHATERIVQDGHPIAYREAAGVVSTGGAALGASTGADYSVTFPSGRFTQPPIVTANCLNANAMLVCVKNVTTTGCTLYIYNAHTAGINRGDISWRATQMLTTTAAG